MTAPDPAAIAKGLTKAQREALLDARKNFAENCLVLAPHRCRNTLIDAGLVSSAFARSISGGKSKMKRLTPLGLAVRAHLENSHD